MINDGVYCEISGHKVSGCKTVILKSTGCGCKHRATGCLSNRSCVKCKGKHHSSIFDKTTTPMLTTSSCSVKHPTVLIEMDGIKCQTLTDAGAGTSYASSTFISRINKKTIQTETKKIAANKIETLMSTNTRNS